MPFVSGPFLDVVVGASDRLLDAGAFVGSLVGVLVLLAVPLVLLGTVTPWALRLAIGEVESAGTVAGRLYALSTVGSLTGVFLSASVFIPLAGVQRTFLLFAAALALAAVASRAALAVVAAQATEVDRVSGRSPSLSKGDVPPTRDRTVTPP